MFVVVVGDNASLRMGGEAMKPLRFFRGYRTAGEKCVLVVHERCREELSGILTRDEMADVIFARNTATAKVLYRLQQGRRRLFRQNWCGALISLVFQRQARNIVRDLSRTSPPDIVHQPTPISPYLPSLLCGFQCPVVVGPMAARPPLPPGLGGGGAHALGRAVLLRIAALANRVFPAKRRAQLLVSANPTTTDVLGRILGPGTRIIETLENAVDDHWFACHRTRRSCGAPHFMFVGRLEKWKCVDVTLEAVALFADPVRITIVGDGPERAALERRAAFLTNAEVIFTGWLDHAAICRLYSTATAAITLSVREAGGTSVQEAMAAGVPVIATAWGGHMFRMDPGAGFLVRPDSREAMIRQTASAMRYLADDPDLGDLYGRRACEIAFERMRWESKISFFLREMAALAEASVAGSLNARCGAGPLSRVGARSPNFASTPRGNHGRK